MRRVVHWVLAGVASVLWAFPGAAEPKSEPGSAVTPPNADDERAFAAAAERYERLREFTQKLVREREQLAFEQAAEHYSRLSELTRTLAEAAAADQARAFDAEVALYLRKRELTRELAARGTRGAVTASPEPSSSAAPSW